jgi:hypothetical protein
MARENVEQCTYHDGGGAAGLLRVCWILWGSSGRWHGWRRDGVRIAARRSRLRGFFLGLFCFASSSVFVSHNRQDATNRRRFPGGETSKDPPWKGKEWRGELAATKAKLLFALSGEAEVGAEAKALDTDLKRSAAAMEQVFEQGLQED